MGTSYDANAQTDLFATDGVVEVLLVPAGGAFPSPPTVRRRFATGLGWLRSTSGVGRRRSRSGDGLESACNSLMAGVDMPRPRPGVVYGGRAQRVLHHCCEIDSLVHRAAVSASTLRKGSDGTENPARCSGNGGGKTQGGD